METLCQGSLFLPQKIIELFSFAIIFLWRIHFRSQELHQWQLLVFSMVYKSGEIPEVENWIWQNVKKR